MHKIEYSIVRILYGIFSSISFRAGRSIAYILYLITAHIIHYRKKTILKNLKLVYGDNLPMPQKALLNNIYKNFIYLWMEFLQTSKLSADNINEHFNIQNFELIDEALSGNKGMIILSGHFGNFEWLGQLVGLKGYKLSGIAKRQSNPYVNALIEKNRTRFGVGVIYTKNSVKVSLEKLAKNEIIAIVTDQDARDRGIFVDFMGIPSSTAVGPAVLYLRSGAPILFVISIRKAYGKFDVFFEKVCDGPAMQTTDELIRGITQRHTLILEKWVKKYPEQWFWMHRRWKTRPYEETDIL
ncbi:MAG: lysophospholipid acyltransferase family protein [Calditrichaceae bacterium]|nr:lysophospholipid acyltransferase family protein [Calditrichaceae bacterium]MBN2710341.1 lysophospholipid acyltransferase family protein [Calditrichaceae bacterium]RQV95091.1 MAG: hypothetical protein EH224_08370 [Calditrichota bacterium]